MLYCILTIFDLQAKAAAIILTLTYEGSLRTNLQDMVVLDKIHSLLCTSLYNDDDDDDASEFEEILAMLKKTSLSENTLLVLVLLERSLKQCVVMCVSW